jgi:thioredoxin-related protein
MFSIFGSSSEWLTDFDQAQREASQSGKVILLNFSGSDWCGPCINLKNKIFDTDDFSNYASGHLLLVNADFPRLKKNKLSAEQTKQNEALADKYNQDGIFPYTVLVNAEGKVLKEWSGLPDETPSMFIQEIRKVTHDGI